MGSAPYINIEVVAVDVNNDGILDDADEAAMIAAKTNYVRRFDIDFDDDVDEADDTWFDETRTNNPDLGTIRDAIRTSTHQELTWDDDWSAYLIQLTDVEATIQEFVGKDSTPVYGWIHVHKHPYKNSTTWEYVCGHFAIDTAIASYKGLGYGCVLLAVSNISGVYHAYNIVWLGGDWTDLHNWRIIEPQSGNVYTATDKSPETMYDTCQIRFFDYTDGLTIYHHYLTVDSQANTVSYGNSNSASYYPTAPEEPYPTTFDRTLGIGVDEEGLYEHYTTNDDATYASYGETWQAQTFTPSEAHKITSVKLKLYRKGSPGTLTASIKATDGSGHPTGSDLCSGTINGNGLTEDTGGLWYVIALGAGYTLEADTKYAIILKALDGSYSNSGQWRVDESGGAYAGGRREVSYNGGSSWTGYTGMDFMFEDWGEPVGVIAPTVTTLPATSIEPTTARLNGQISDDGEESCQYRFRYKKSGGGYSYTTWTGSKTTGQTFYENISGLDKKGLYYFNAQAKNSAGESAWGSELNFATLATIPIVTTQAVTDIEASTATGHGNITDIGGENCDARGICWNTSGNPTIASNKSEQAGSFGTGAFSLSITGLISGETYYVKAYAHNSAGYGYGNQVEFTFAAGTIIDVPFASVSSEGKSPTMSLGISLLPYTVPIAYVVLLTPTVATGRTVEVPTLNVDSQAPSPDWSQGILLSPPMIAIDSEGKAPDLIRDGILTSPLAAMDGTALTPELFDAVWILIEPPVVEIDSGAVTIFPSNVAIDGEALLVWFGDADIHPPVISLDTEVLTPSLGGISITIQPPVVVIESGAILFLPPTATIDSAGLTPTPGLDRAISSPMASVESNGISPTLALDRVFGVPLVLVDSEALTAAFALEALIDSPLVTIDGEGLVVTFSLDKILDIGLTQLAIEAPTPFLAEIRNLTIVVPLAAIEGMGLAASVLLSVGFVPLHLHPRAFSFTLRARDMALTLKPRVFSFTLRDKGVEE